MRAPKLITMVLAESRMNRKLAGASVAVATPSLLVVGVIALVVEAGVERKSEPVLPEREMIRLRRPFTGTHGEVPPEGSVWGGLPGRGPTPPHEAKSGLNYPGRDPNY